MAITFNGESVDSNSGTSITATEPTGAGQDDILVAFMYGYNSGSYPTWDTPSGWTKQHTVQYNSGSDYNDIGIYWIRRGASAPALTFSRSNGSDYNHCRIVRIDGCRTTGNPFTATAITPVTASTTINPPSVSTSAGEVVFCGGYMEAGNGGGWVAPSGYTLTVLFSASGLFTSADKTISSGSSEDPGAFGAETSSSQFGFSWSLTDAAGGDLNLNLSGTASTSESGTLTQSRSIAQSGQASTSAAGTLTIAVSKALSGEAPQGQAGSVTYSADGAVTLTLSGAQSAAEAGTVSPAIAKALSGQASSAQAGTLTPTWQAQYTWDDIVGEDGYRVKWGTAPNTYTASADVGANVTSYTITNLAMGTTYYARVYALLGGLEQDGSVERILTQNDITLVLSGASATTTAGTISYGLSRTASGQLATVFPGAIATARTLAPTGAAATAQTGALAVNTSGGVTAALTGAEATSSAGTVSEGLSLALTGLQITAAPGSVSASSSQGVTLTLSGQAATATAGSLSTARVAALSGTVATMLPGNVGMPGNANPEFDLLAAVCRIAPRGTRLWRACRAAGYPVR